MCFLCKIERWTQCESTPSSLDERTYSTRFVGQIAQAGDWLDVDLDQLDLAWLCDICDIPSPMIWRRRLVFRRSDPLSHSAWEWISTFFAIIFEVVSILILPLCSARYFHLMYQIFPNYNENDFKVQGPIHKHLSTLGDNCRCCHPILTRLTKTC